MPIQVQGQYYLQFSVQDKTDFILEGDLVHFAFGERSGNALPVFEMVFYTGDDDILRYLTEMNDFQVTFGSDIDNAVDVSLVIITKETLKSGIDRRLIYLDGFLSMLPYTTNRKVSLSDPLTGVEAIKSVSDNYFTWSPTSNLEISTDEPMVWAQSNVSDRNYVSLIAAHVWLPDSFFACSISSFSEFIARDMKLAAAQPPAWIFDPQSNDPNSFTYDPPYNHKDNSGVINSWLGRGQITKVFDVDAGGDSDEDVEMDSVASLANASGAVVRAGLLPQVTPPRIITENVHPDYWNAYYQNLNSNASASILATHCSVTGVFFPIRVLDVVLFREYEMSDDGNQIEPSEAMSGLYYVSKVTRVIRERRLTTHLMLTREAISQPIPPAT